MEPHHVSLMFEQTKCDAVMIGRGAVHNPWIFQQAREYMLTGKILPPPTLRERVDTLKEHMRFSVDYKGEPKGVYEMRKHFSGYLKGMPNISKFRLELMQYDSLEKVLDRLDEFLLERESEVDLLQV